MDSLIASYASASSDSESDEEGGNDLSQFSSSAPVTKGEPNSSIFTALPPPKNNNSYISSPSPSLKPQQGDASSSSLFSSLPPAKTRPQQGDISSSLLFSSLPPAKARSQQGDASSSSLFSSLPPAKARSGFSLPSPKNKPGKRVVEFKPPLNPALLENVDDEEQQERASKRRATSDDSKALAGGLTALLPPPKNDNLLGAGGAHTGRRFFLETAPSTYQPPANSEEPCLDFHHSLPSYSGAAITPSQNDYYYSADPPSQGRDFSSSGGATWSHTNHHPQPCPPQEAVYVQGNEPIKEVQQVSEGDGSSFGKAEERKRGRNQIPSNVIEVKQDELMGNRPREDQAKLTGIAFGPSYKPVSSGKDKPTKLHKRKHQIGSLYFDLKQKEMELAERRAKGQLTKAETQAKYGW